MEMTRPKQSPKRPTMADVASEAGVNRSTVARVIEQPDLVAKKTLRKVEDAIAKLGYMPNRLASALRGKRSRIVTILAPPRLAAVYGAIVTELTKRLGKEGLIVNLFPVSRDENENVDIIREAVGWSPAVLVNVGMPIAENAIKILKSSGIPIVHLLDHPTIQFGSCVSYDHKAAALSLTSHLISRGNRHIGYVHRGVDKNGLRLSGDRFEGFCEAIKNFGGTVIPAMDDASSTTASHSSGRLIGQEINTPEGFTSGKALLKQTQEIGSLDALLFGSEMTAIRAASALLENNIAVPDQLSLAMFDGTELNDVISPQITCLDYAYIRIAEAGARKIVEMSNSPDAPHVDLEVPFAIRVGETT